MKTSIPSQKLVVQVLGEPNESCYARLYGCHGILGGVISVSVIFSVDDHQVVVLHGARCSELPLLSIRPVRPYYSRNNRWFKTLTPASWCDTQCT